MKANEKQVGGMHYKTEYEHWDLAIAIPLGYLEGCATKYVSRWRKKGGAFDLRKAKHYLEKLMEVADYKLTRNLQPEEIRTAVAKFAKINGLGVLEAEFIEFLCTYRHHVDLIEARYTLDDLIEYAETVDKLDEITRPGTPEDGGHHAV